MEQAIAMVKYFMDGGSVLIVAVLNAASNCNVPVADLLSKFN